MMSTNGRSKRSWMVALAVVCGTMFVAPSAWSQTDASANDKKGPVDDLVKRNELRKKRRMELTGQTSGTATVKHAKVTSGTATH